MGKTNTLNETRRSELRVADRREDGFPPHLRRSFALLNYPTDNYF